MQRIDGVVQHYGWGDHTFIPRLRGIEPDGRPWAEWWLGTHPNGPATLDDGRPLRDVTGDLPFLLKVLAAAEPLSLQTHPNAHQAREGHARGIYPDPHPKPELLCALTQFEALCGIRPVAATLELLDDLGVDALRRVIAVDGPGAALASLYRGEIEPGPIIAACSESERVEAQWVGRLAQRYPDEPSVAASLLLNHVSLQPGEAIHLAAGNLHAYLAGAGIELMGASDNVVRGGLTVKPVDVDELLRVVDPTPLSEPVLPAADGCYPLPEVGVQLRRLDRGTTHRARDHEVAVDLDGGAWYYAPGDTVTVAATTYVVTSS